jgi:hypothetical protein
MGQASASKRLKQGPIFCLKGAQKGGEKNVTEETEFP